MGWFDEINNKLGYTKGHLTDGGKAAVGLTYASSDESSPEYNEVVYESPYTLPEVTVKAPDMRAAKAAREREDYNDLMELTGDVVGSFGPWSPVYWGAKSAYGLYNGVPRTYNFAKKGEWGKAALSAGDNLLDATEFIPVSRFMPANGRLLHRAAELGYDFTPEGYLFPEEEIRSNNVVEKVGAKNVNDSNKDKLMLSIYYNMKKNGYDPNSWEERTRYYIDFYNKDPLLDELRDENGRKYPKGLFDR